MRRRGFLVSTVVTIVLGLGACSGDGRGRATSSTIAKSTTTSTVLELRDGAIRTYTVDPADFGIAPPAPDALAGGDATRNVELAKSVLSGEKSAYRDIVLLNAAAGLLAAGTVDDLASGFDAARSSIDGGAAAEVLVDVVRVTQAARAAEVG